MLKTNLSLLQLLTEDFFSFTSYWEVVASQPASLWTTHSYLLCLIAGLAHGSKWTGLVSRQWFLCFFQQGNSIVTSSSIAFTEQNQTQTKKDKILCCNNFSFSQISLHQLLPSEVSPSLRRIIHVLNSCMEIPVKYLLCCKDERRDYVHIVKLIDIFIQIC